MEILGIEIDWMEKYTSSDPRIIIEVDKLPKVEDLRYDEHPNAGGTLYVSRTPEGYVSYMQQTSNKTGSGGRVYDINLTNGETRTIEGAWSSRAACVNSQMDGPSQYVVDVTYKETGTGYDSRFSAAIDYLTLLEVMDRFGIHETLHISREGKNPKFFKYALSRR